MSGGSLDYVFGRVEDAAEEIKRRAGNPLQKAFAEHLNKVAQALHDLEWHYSGDTYNPEPESLSSIVNKEAVLGVLNEEAKNLIEDMKRYTK